MKKNKRGGFTLLELLIVIAILAILSVALVIVLNPAETLKKARDAQRISDLSTLKTAIGLYMTSVSPVYLGALASNATCQAAAGTWGSGNKIFYSYPTASGSLSATTLDGTAAATLTPSQAATPGLTNGTGWIPVNFGNISGGSPISAIPVDPVNTVASITAPAQTDLVYRYGCSASPLGFEIDATLESTAYTVTDNKYLSDGGNSNLYYETGTVLNILGKTAVGVDF